MQELNMKNSLDANMVQMSANYCLVYVAISAALFYRLGTHFLPMYIPYSVVEKNKQWLFKNICNSFVHSFISSIWIAFCLWNYPAHRYDFINVYSNQSYLLLCFSVGYFLYDFLDMLVNDRDSSFHLLVHHLVVVGVFGVAIYSRYYLGYAMVGLLVEVNSVFLHVRTLMRLTGNAQTSPRIYRTVCWMNFVTFLVFRIYLLAYLTHWLFSHRAFLNTTLFIFTLPCLITINVMSWLLLFKITVEDFSTPLLAVCRALGCHQWVDSIEKMVAAAAKEATSTTAGLAGGVSKNEGVHMTSDEKISVNEKLEGAIMSQLYRSDKIENEKTYVSDKIEGARSTEEDAQIEGAKRAEDMQLGGADLSFSRGFGTDKMAANGFVGGENREKDSVIEVTKRNLFPSEKPGDFLLNCEESSFVAHSGVDKTKFTATPGGETRQQYQNGVAHRFTNHTAVNECSENKETDFVGKLKAS
uniref:TLC domain-containing protein 2 n=1 Tax=Cacopsylla melanoneura TaxID=428564 RepID=A0A8D8PTI9_9HEMI